jgi:hypothetical protein
VSGRQARCGGISSLRPWSHGRVSSWPRDLSRDAKSNKWICICIPLALVAESPRGRFVRAVRPSDRGSRSEIRDQRSVSKSNNISTTCRVVGANRYLRSSSSTGNVRVTHHKLRRPATSVSNRLTPDRKAARRLRYPKASLNSLHSSGSYIT